MGGQQEANTRKESHGGFASAASAKSVASEKPLCLLGPQLRVYLVLVLRFAS